jgi:hypothetical protein
MDIWECRSNILSTMVYAYEHYRYAEAMDIRKQLPEESETFEPGKSCFHIIDIAEAYEKPGDAINAITYYGMLKKR